MVPASEDYNYRIQYKIINPQKSFTMKDLDNEEFGIPIYFEGLAKVHTLGLSRYGVKELMIPIDCGLRLAKMVFDKVCFEIFQNNFIISSAVYKNFIHPGLDVQFLDLEDYKYVIVIVPDEHGRLPYDSKCSKYFSRQSLYAEIIYDIDTLGNDYL